MTSKQCTKSIFNVDVIWTGVETFFEYPLLNAVFASHNFSGSYIVSIHTVKYTGNIHHIPTCEVKKIEPLKGTNVF